jgi:hypothetical protein
LGFKAFWVEHFTFRDVRSTILRLGCIQRATRGVEAFES